VLKLRKIFDCKKEEMAGDRTTIHNESFVIFSPLTRYCEDSRRVREVWHVV
jgi:hypothetical protein